MRWPSPQGEQRQGGEYRGTEDGRRHPAALLATRCVARERCRVPPILGARFRDLRVKAIGPAPRHEVAVSGDRERPLIEERGWTRCRPIKSMFRPPEHDDLQAIAEGWGVPLATAVWAIVVGELARYRREAPEFGAHGLTIAAAVRVLRMKRNAD